MPAGLLLNVLDFCGILAFDMSFDPIARRAARGGPFTVLIAGDWAPIRAFDSRIANDPASAYGDLLDGMRAADLRIVNCECALSEGGQPVWKSGSAFKGRPAHVRGLTCVPFEVACLANNHVLDYGVDAFAETVATLRGSGVRTLGAGLSEADAWEPLTLELGESRLSLVNFSEGEDLTAARGGPGVAGWEIPRVCDLVRRLKTRGDCVIAVAHAGLEYVPFPPPYLQQAYRAVIEAGADCVAGHHAHVPQGIELYRGRPIAYSLGNFVFYQPTDLYWRKIGFLLELELAEGAVRRFQAQPHRITESGLGALGREEKAEFRGVLAAISEPLSEDGGCERAWEAYLDYYGAEGLEKELGGILEALQAEPPKGAAMLRNRLTTPQHAELWRDLLRRIMAGGPAPRKDLAARIREWFERTIQPLRDTPPRPAPGNP
jgi:poly-gamma-glutamate synthesis protein (capsule biosynthesis protein)